MPWNGVINKYKEFMPVSDSTPVITLNEGNTPHIPLKHIPQMLGNDIQMWVKFEGLNPTGSFKDRGMASALRLVACESHSGKSAWPLWSM